MNSLAGCASKKTAHITVDTQWLDSVRSKADTVYSKKYRNNEFVTAEYLVNKKDSFVCQVMKDSSGMIRQIIQAKNNVRIYTSSFYSNGQLMAKLLTDSFGKFNGPAVYYFENGNVKEEGVYLHGFYSGSWKNYDDKNNLLYTSEYNANGELINATK